MGGTPSRLLKGLEPGDEHVEAAEGEHLGQVAYEIAQVLMGVVIPGKDKHRHARQQQLELHEGQVRCAAAGRVAKGPQALVWWGAGRQAKLAQQVLELRRGESAAGEGTDAMRVATPAGFRGRGAVGAEEVLEGQGHLRRLEEEAVHLSRTKPRGFAARGFAASSGSDAAKERLGLGARYCSQAGTWAGWTRTNLRQRRVSMRL